MADNVPIVLGQYRVGKTLGIGAFGKVKCESIKTKLYLVSVITLLHMTFGESTNFDSLIFRSGTSHYNEPKSGSEDFKQRQDKTHGNGRESQTRNKYIKDVHSSSHYSPVSVNSVSSIRNRLACLISFHIFDQV